MAFSSHSSGKIFLLLGLVSAFVLILCLNSADAQVNFSPGWGKRGMNTVSGPGGGVPQQDSACKPSMDTILHIYKLLQAEAQKLASCEKFSNE